MWNSKTISFLGCVMFLYVLTHCSKKLQCSQTYHKCLRLMVNSEFRETCMLPDIISYMSIWSGSKKLNAAFDVHSAQTKIWYVTCEGGISQLCKLSCSVNVATLCKCVLPIRLSGLMGASAISCQYMIQGNFVCGWFVSVLRQPLWLVTKLEEQSKTIIFCCTMMTNQNH